MYLSTSTSTLVFSAMYLSTFRVLYKLYLSTDVLKYKVLLPGFGILKTSLFFIIKFNIICMRISVTKSVAYSNLFVDYIHEPVLENRPSIITQWNYLPSG